MEKVSDHFWRTEFECKCGCGFAAVDVEMLLVLENLRDMFGDHPLTILSGCRCAEHNADPAIGGAPDSFHVKAMAVDMRIKFTDAKSVYQYLANKFPFKYGVGLYPGRVHLDIRPKPARWEVNSDDRQGF